MREVRRRLRGVPFPATKDMVVAAAGDVRVAATGGGTVPLAEVLAGTTADEFTSPRHVAEVARLAWSLPTDQHPPEGSG